MVNLPGITIDGTKFHINMNINIRAATKNWRKGRQLLDSYSNNKDVVIKNK